MSEEKDSMFSEGEIQEVWIHCPFIQVLTISYRNSSIVMKIIPTEKSDAHKIIHKMIRTQNHTLRKIIDPK